jgi:solute:Na+ symporter, SSS family
MSGEFVALSMVVVVVAVGSAIGFYAGPRYKMDLEQWAVAGRGFGVVLVWLLMAGEVYTAFSFLGASGWAYSRGGPALYILAYLTLAYVVSFFFVPQLWEVGRAHRLQTESDFFEKRYGSRRLAAFVSIIGVVFLVPYVELQLTGLGIIVEVTSFDAVGRRAAMVVAAVVIAGFVFAGGIRSVAWVSVLKDFMLITAAVAIGVGVPYVWFHGIGPMFTALVRTHPSHLVMPGATTNLGHAWFISTVVLNALGAYMWPQNFGACFTARSGNILRRNAVIMPLYTITLPFIFLAGLAALLIVPGLANPDLSLLTVARRTFPAWTLGLIGGAGALTAMVPAAIQILTAAALVAKNFYRPLFNPSMTDYETGRLARIIVIVVTGAALYFSLHSSTTLVNLLLIGYDGVTQFFPGVIFGLYWKRATRTAVSSGLAAGLAIVTVLVLTKHDPLFGLNAGFLALIVNVSIVAAVSLLCPPEPSGFDAPAAARLEA